MFGSTELIIILIIVVVLFGASRLPELGKGIGEAIKNFKKSTSDKPEIDVTPGNNNEDSGESQNKKA